MGHSCLGWCLHACTFPPHLGCLLSSVGGLKSPWKGEYKEPRPPPPDQATCHQTPPRENPPAKASTDGASEPRPPLPPEPPEQSRAPAPNLSKEESGTWEPLPLSSLEPAPAKGPSFPDRRATFPELELQQLEIGMVLGCGRACTHTQDFCCCCSQPRLSSTPFLAGRPLQVVQEEPWEPSPSQPSSSFPPSELFLNSLSQPFSLEEQEQILSCLSIDSLSVSEDSEKVSS